LVNPKLVGPLSATPPAHFSEMHNPCQKDRLDPRIFPF